MRIPIPFALQAYEARSLPFAAQRCVNYFAEPGTAGAKSGAVAYNGAGIKAFADGLAGAVRGREVMGGVLYVLAGSTLYSVTAAGVATSLGMIGTAVGPVSMAVNRADPQELAIADGASGWIYDTSNGLVEIADSDFGTPDTVTFQDGYFIFNESGTSQFFISALNDGTSYSATDFGDAEGSPDAVVAVVSNHRELWIFGTNTTEVWFNSGNADFPFERIAGGYLERGCAAPFSIAADDNTLFWLADDKTICRAAGYAPQIISTPAISDALEQMTDVSDAEAFFYTMSGHKFYVISFPTGRRTFVYDVSTRLWHERESFGARYWRASNYVNVYGRHLVGDAFQGRIGELDQDTFTEFGGVMQGIVTSPPIHKDRFRLFHRRLEIDIESGVGTTSGGDPQMWIDWSDDGGRTWSAQKPLRSMGPIGAYKTRLYINRLGQARERIYRLSVSDAVKRSIISAFVDIDVGMT